MREQNQLALFDGRDHLYRRAEVIIGFGFDLNDHELTVIFRQDVDLADFSLEVSVQNPILLLQQQIRR